MELAPDAPGLRRGAVLRQGRHRLRHDDGQGDALHRRRVRRDGARQHPHPDHERARGKGPQGLLERRAGPVWLSACGPGRQVQGACGR